MGDEKKDCPHCQTPKSGESTGQHSRSGLKFYICSVCSKRFEDD